MPLLLRGLPSQVKGAGLRTLSRRGSWVQIPPPAPVAYGFGTLDGPVILSCREISLTYPPRVPVAFPVRVLFRGVFRGQGEEWAWKHFRDKGPLV